ncbi:MAG: Flp pilus assembly complex ATPase component TadA [Elusimicrobia bacterium]|nr:Flp pilus assembly complex ATPase component TadA [Candidatus Obscuribacterium magneticum]
MSTNPNVSARKTIADIFLEHNLLDQEKVDKALAEAKSSQKPIQQVVVDLQLADRVDVLQVLSKEWRVRAVDLAEIDVDPEVVKIVSEQNARRHLAIPFAKEDKVLLVAMADPRDFFISEDIHIRTGYEVQSYLALPEDILRELGKVYGMASAALAEDIVKGITEQIPEDTGISLEKMEEAMDVTEVDASAPEVERIVNAIIVGALQVKASDIHIEPFEHRFVVRYRVDGILREASFQIPMSYKNAVIAKVKIMTNQMDITERRKPQDGRIQVSAKGNPVEFRVNIVPTVFGESCVMRVLDRASVRVDLNKLGFHVELLEKFKEILKKPYGLILVCGPTGSGKSTTLYAALNSINDPETKILTAENPVEYNLGGIVQTNINPEIGFTFAEALRAFLRQDPDIIMVGEIRDKETAQIAMEAAMTGHLVFSTIHTNDAPSAVARLHEMGVPSFLISGTIEAVLAQRLVRRVCGECARPAQPTDEMKELFHKFKIDISKAKFMKGKGCPTCNNGGYKGRAGIHELLIMDDPIRRLLTTEVSGPPIRDLAVKGGMRLMIADGLIKVTQGVTTVEEVFAATQ